LQSITNQLITIISRNKRLNKRNSRQIIIAEHNTAHYIKEERIFSA